MYKVLFLGWEYYPVYTGGLGVVCTAMAEEMANQDMEVYVTLPGLPKTIPVGKVRLPQHVPEIQQRLRKFHSNVSMNPYGGMQDSYFNGSLNGDKALMDDLYGGNLIDKVIQYKDEVDQLAMDLEFDIIHAHDWMTFSAAINAKNKTGKKAVLHVHATEYDRTGGNPNQLIFNIEREMLKQADMVIAVSAHTKKMLIKFYDLDPTKIKVIHNSLEEKPQLSKHNLELIKDKGPMVLFLGRLVIQKGVENFIKIAHKITQFIPNAQFVIAGDGPLFGPAMHLAHQLGIGDNVIFTGFVNREEGDRLYKAADLYIMTSGSEPFGITALESVAQGTPAIVSKTSGVAEAIKNALTVDYWDLNKYADYAVNLLQDKTLYDVIVREQEKDLHKLSWRTQVERISEIYFELMSA